MNFIRSTFQWAYGRKQEPNDDNISMPALGRTFGLGMLYNKITDKIVPGKTLWDPEQLDSNVNIREHQGSAYCILTEDSLDEKSSALEMEPSIKLSFLGKLVDIGGAAKFLSDKKPSKYVSRVTLKYRCTTEYRELTMSHLAVNRITHNDVLHGNIATHVVVGILYGGQAFFVFDRRRTSEDDQRDIECELKATITKIPSLVPEAGFNLTKKDKENREDDKISCRFYGDVLLEKNPTTYNEAVEVYKTLSSLIKKNAVPLEVYLCPLSSLHSGPFKMIREVTDDVSRRLNDFFVSMENLTIQCNDLLEMPSCVRVKELQRRIIDFQKQIDHFKSKVQRWLGNELTLYRNLSRETVTIELFLRKIDGSPFNSALTSIWIDQRKQELLILDAYLKRLVGIKIIDRNDLVPLNIHENEVVVMTILLPFEHDEFLQQMKTYIINEGEWENTSIPVAAWSQNQKRRSRIRNCISSFQAFKETYKSGIMCMLTFSDHANAEHHNCVHIEFYENGEVKSDPWYLPYPPSKLKIEVSRNGSVEVKWSKPEFGADDITGYEVQYRMKDARGYPWRILESKCCSVRLFNLQYDHTYEFRVQSIMTKEGFQWKGECSNSTTLFVGMPREENDDTPVLVKKSSSTICLEWTELQSKYKNISQYEVKYLECNDENNQIKWRSKTTDGLETYTTLTDLKSKTEFQIKVRPVFSNGEEGPFCTNSLKVKTDESLSERVLAESTVKSLGQPTIYKIPLRRLESSVDARAKTRKCIFGKWDSLKAEKTMILVGATGSGKSTLIEGMINYIFDVSWEEKFRFSIIDLEEKEKQRIQNKAQSQTDWITCYSIPHRQGSPIDFNINIIDTPGFCDTQGIIRDRELVAQIRSFFTSKGDKGISCLDAICFVTQAPSSKLNSTQKYIFDSVLSIFGQDVKDNIFVLITFADGSEPPVLAALQEAKMPYTKSFKFNNSALYEDHSTENLFGTMFWKMGKESFRIFFQDLNQVTPKSLQLTAEVLVIRKTLETNIEKLQQHISEGVSQLDVIKQERQILEYHKRDIRANKNFTYKVKEPVHKMINLDPGTYVTNCLTCNRTCHYPCMIPNDENKACCTAMSNENCTVCPKKCHWTLHKNNNYRFKSYRVTKTKTYEELQEKYNMAKEKGKEKQSLIEKVETEFSNTSHRVMTMVIQVRQDINKLNEIALRQNPLTDIDYIDLLIENEREELGDGWGDRLQLLLSLRKQAQLMAQTSNTNFKPWIGVSNILTQVYDDDIVREESDQENEETEVIESDSDSETHTSITKRAFLRVKSVVLGSRQKKGNTEKPCTTICPLNKNNLNY